MNWFIYRKSDGLFTGLQIGATLGEIDASDIPEGCAAITGVSDWKYERVSEDGLIVPYVPPQPDEDHTLVNGRWVKRAEVVERQHQRRIALKAIERLEAKQPRALREVALGKPGALDRLAEIEAQIEELRKQL